MASPTGRDGSADHGPARLVVGLILLCLGLQAWLALAMEINWDEFFYLSHIYAYQRGELDKALQALQVHLLGWVTAVPGNEIDQVEAGRLFMLACFGGSCFLVYALSRGFLSRLASLVAVLAFASAGFSIIHGASFRADPLSALLTMASLVIFARARAGILPAVAAGLVAAAAAMITVKVVLYAPAFLGVAAWRLSTSEDRRPILLGFGTAALCAAAGFAALYAIQLHLMPNAAAAASRASLGNAAETQVTAGFIPRIKELLQFVALSPVQSFLLVLGIGATAPMLRLRSSRGEGLALLGCGGTLLCLLLYRNAFPYFFPFIFAPSAVVAGVAIDRQASLGRHVTLLALAMGGTALAVGFVWSSHGQSAQRQLVSAVHAIFPSPVAYIDRNSMIASFPKRGFFMSTWGMQNYRRAGRPVFADLLAEDAVPLVILNGPALENAFGALPDEASSYHLVDEDKALLRATYIPHWGPLWVAGKTLRQSDRATLFAIAVPGTYTIEGVPASIDGRRIARGGTVALARGPHVLGPGPDGLLTLRWGDHLGRPARPFVGPVYRGF